MIIDVHTHIFPEKIAYKAAQAIGTFYDAPMRYDGTLEKLLSIADTYQIDKLIVHSVATVAAQVTSINDFLLQTIAQHPDRLIGFATMHPDMPDPQSAVQQYIQHGFKGVKLHPDFQRFAIDDPKLDTLYGAIAGNLPLLLHTGDKRYQFSNPQRVLPIIRRFPKLKLICAHFGGWSEWEDAAALLAKEEQVWVDTSSTIAFIGVEKAKQLLTRFHEDRILFGSDYPMWNPGDELAFLDQMRLPDSLKEKILYQNITQLLSLNDKN